MEKFNYQKQATDFLEKKNIDFSTKYIGCSKHFQDDKEDRDRYLCTFIKRQYPIKRLEIKFGQSIANTNGGKTKPTAYDVLTAIIDCDPGTFNNFCGDYGYDNDSRKAQELYFAVQEEWEMVKAFFTSEELAEVIEIQ